MGGRLEHAIRLLPQVLACSLSDQGDIVVLADASADARAIHNAVERVLQKQGASGSVRIIGPGKPAVSPFRSTSPSVTTATIATVAAIGVGTLVSGFAVADRVPAPSPMPFVAATTAPFDSVDSLRELQTTSPVVARPGASVSSTNGVPLETPDLARAAALAFFRVGPARDGRTHRPHRGAAHHGGNRNDAPGRAGDHQKSPRASHLNAHLPTWDETYLPSHPQITKGPDHRG